MRAAARPYRRNELYAGAAYPGASAIPLALPGRRFGCQLLQRPRPAAAGGTFISDLLRIVPGRAAVGAVSMEGSLGDLFSRPLWRGRSVSGAPQALSRFRSRQLRALLLGTNRGVEIGLGRRPCLLRRDRQRVPQLLLCDPRPGTASASCRGRSRAVARSSAILELDFLSEAAG